MLVTCPHCNQHIIIDQINCGIFRHAMYKTGMPFPPHASKQMCDDAINQAIIYGCGKPFRVVGDKAVVCDYV